MGLELVRTVKGLNAQIIVGPLIALVFSSCYLTISRLAPCGPKAVASVNDILRFGQVNSHCAAKTEHQYGLDSDQVLDLYRIDSTGQDQKNEQ